jgi:ATP-dependent exoDNAse (exonuclease V) alpha subunit
VKLSIGDYTRPELENAWSEALKTGDIIQYNDQAFTTPEMERIETRIIEQAVRDGKAFEPLFSEERALHAVQNYEVAKGFDVTTGQKSAIVMALTSEGRLNIIAGDAGSGKTTLFDAVNTAVTDMEDVNVIGLSCQGKAAAVLEASSGIKSMTIDSFLLRQPEQVNGETRQIWVVDESSMLGSRHLHALLENAELANAQIILVGDTKQIASISAGKMMSELQRLDLVNTAIMDEVMRQKTDWTKEITHALKKQDLETVFGILGRAGKITEMAERDERLNATAEKYVQTIAEGHNPLVMTLSNADRCDLLVAIRERQKEVGQIGKDDVKVTTREPVNLQGIDKLLAVNYDVGNLIIFNSAVGPFKEGDEVRINANDLRSNSISVSDRDGRTEKISLRENGSRLFVLREHETNFATGERGIFLKNDNTAQGKFLGIKNGVTFTIENIDPDGTASLRLENGNFLKRDLNGAHLTNGQAITVDKAQGMSEHTGILMAASDASSLLLNENKNYVGMSRMTHNMELVTDNRKLLMESIKGEQVKTSTIEYTMTTERLSDLKAATTRYLENRIDEPGLMKEAEHAHEREGMKKSLEMTMDL